MRYNLFNNIILEVISGDITKQNDIDVIVNAANKNLLRGGGVCGAIFNAAGSELDKECATLAPIETGEAVITKAYNLPNKFIIHTAGPIYGIDKNEEKLLANCYKNSLLLADSHKLNSIAFPSISTGIYGYPFEKASIIAYNTIKDTSKSLNYIKLIRYILYSNELYSNFVKLLNDQ